MPEPQRFLQEVERELGRRLPSREIPERLAELTAHLDDAVEAYAEMGLPTESAVRAMGSPHTLAKGLADAALSPWARRRLHFAAFALAGYGANLAGLPNLYLPWLTQLVAALSVASTFAAAYAAFRARHPDPVKIALTGLALTVPMSFAMAVLWIRIPREDGQVGWTPPALQSYVRARLVRTGDTEGLRRLDDALASPLKDGVADSFPFAVTKAASLTAIMGGVDLTFGILGLASLSLRRRRQLA